MCSENEFLIGSTFVFYLVAFIVWVRLAHIIRGRYGVSAAIMFLPMVIGLGAETTVNAWKLFGDSVIPSMCEQSYSISSAIMGIGTAFIGIWVVCHLQCSGIACRKDRAAMFFHEMFKAIPDHE